MTGLQREPPGDPSLGHASTISGHAAEGAPQPVAREQDISSATVMIAALAAAALAGSLDAAAALASLTAARRLAAELERGELALIDAARDGGATWSRIAAAMGTRNRQTAQKRHADLARRHPRPPAVDTPSPALPPPRSRQGRAGHDGSPGIAHDPGPAARREAKPAGKVSRDREDPRREPAPAPAAGRRSGVPKITDAVIAEGRYEIVKAPDHAETRAWHVLVGGWRAGLVRPTWRGERSRPGWEGVDNSGTALPATGIGRVTAAGNARTRDAAAVSLLRALQQEREGRRDPRPGLARPRGKSGAGRLVLPGAEDSDVDGVHGADVVAC